MKATPSTGSHRHHRLTVWISWPEGSQGILGTKTTGWNSSALEETLDELSRASVESVRSLRAGTRGMCSRVIWKRKPAGLAETTSRAATRALKQVRDLLLAGFVKY